MVFAHAQLFRIVNLRARQNIEKCGFGPSKIVPGRSKIRPGATRNAKKTTNVSKKRPTNAQEAAKIEKKAPKSEKCANMVPTLSQQGQFGPRIGFIPPPPPKACKALC